MGGAERQMIALATRLARDRFEPGFIFLAEMTKYPTELTAAGIRTWSARAERPVGERSTGRVARTARMWGRYVAIARRERFDIVDAWLYPAEVMAALLRPATATPVVVAGRRGIDLQGRFGPLERPLRGMALHWTDAVVANSTAEARRAVADGADPATVRIIRNGVEVAPPASSEERSARRHAMRVEDDVVLIGCVGHLRPGKGQALVIEAVAALIAEGLPVRLRFVGEGTMRPALERRIRELGLEGLIELHGLERDPLRLYPAFDLVVSGSDREGLPNVLLEAAAAGRGIVATAAGGSTEIVLDGQTGLLVPPGDRAALTGAVRRLVLDRDLRDRLGEAARTHVRTAFGMDRFVADFSGLYEELAAARGLPRSHR